MKRLGRAAQMTRTSMLDSKHSSERPTLMHRPINCFGVSVPMLGEPERLMCCVAQLEKPLRCSCNSWQQLAVRLERTHKIKLLG